MKLYLVIIRQLRKRTSFKVNANIRVTHQNKQTLFRILCEDFPPQASGLYVVNLRKRKNTISHLFGAKAYSFICLNYFIFPVVFGIEKNKWFVLFIFLSLGAALKIFNPLRMLCVNKGKPKLKEASGLAVEKQLELSL